MFPTCPNTVGFSIGMSAWDESLVFVICCSNGFKISATSLDFTHTRGCNCLQLAASATACVSQCFPLLLWHLYVAKVTLKANLTMRLNFLLALFLISCLNIFGKCIRILQKRNMFKRKMRERSAAGGLLETGEMVLILLISIHLFKFPFLQVYGGRFYNQT